MLTILLRPNLNKKDAVACSGAIAEKLRALGARVSADYSAKKYLGGNCEYGDYQALLPECDIVMPVGGDGTVMRAAKDAMLADKPIIGVNAGRVGFLTQLEACELDKLVLLIRGEYGISERLLLRGEITGEDAPSEPFLALNDIVVSHGSFSGIADIEVRESGRLITRQRGDGLIFATPTGSTAYSLSAGGPVADPELDILILTAICPHATFRYSLALPVKGAYTVREMIVNRDSGLVVAADGKKAGILGPDDRLIIQKHTKSVKFINLGLHDFYGRIGEKLSWNSESTLK